MLDNARDLEQELDWFARVLEARLTLGHATDTEQPQPQIVPAPDLRASNSWYARFLGHYRFSESERLVLLLALIPHIRPQMLDVLWSRNQTIERGFTEFGGVQGASHGGFLPTGETAAFLLAGDDLAARFAVMAFFAADHVFARHAILRLAAVAPGEPQLSGALVLSSEYVAWLTTGSEHKPNYNSEFPARLITTRLDWHHLVLPAFPLAQLEEIRHWVRHGQQLLSDWEMEAKLPPGFTALFHGPAGTGKTLAACLLGKHCGCDVYKIDLSLIVSKYIGETEKNLAKIFDMAEHKGWILFFDEADALFGKRTRVDDAHDRYANQEVSFLLQRIEEFNGVVVLASNIKANIDEAFLRRLHTVIHFPLPKPAERLRIWRDAFPAKARLDPTLDLERIAEKYELAGGAIMNVVRFAALRALSRESDRILADDVAEGIRRELLKEGRTV